MSLPIAPVLNNCVDAASLWQTKDLHTKNLEFDRKLHQESISVGLRHHEEAVKLAKENHSQTLIFESQTHRREMNNALELHYHQLLTDFINATRESERSMYDQRNAEFQTLIISSTVMFTALSTVIVQGILPLNASYVVYVFYAISCGLSFAFHFLCIVLLIKIVVRSSKFMYHRSNRQSKRVHKVIDSTVDLMKKIRNFTNMEDHKLLDLEVQKMHDKIVKSYLEDENILMAKTNDEISPHDLQPSPAISLSSFIDIEQNEDNGDLRLRNPFNEAIEEPSSAPAALQSLQSLYYDEEDMLLSSASSLPTPPQPSPLQRLASLTPSFPTEPVSPNVILRKLFHRVFSFANLSSRNNPEHSTTSQREEEFSDEGGEVKDGGVGQHDFETGEDAVRGGRGGGKVMSPPRKGSFEYFWRHHCEGLARAAMWLYILGTAALLLAVADFMYAEFSLTYDSPDGAYTGITFLGLSLVFSLLLAIFMKDEPTDADY